MEKMKYYLYSVLLAICLYSCSSTDDDKQEPQPPIEIPDADELASIGVGLVAYYTFDDETGDDSSPNHYDAALINRPDMISDTPSNKGKTVYLRQVEKQYINIPYQLFKNTTYSEHYLSSHIICVQKAYSLLFSIFSSSSPTNSGVQS